MLKWGEGRDILQRSVYIEYSAGSHGGFDELRWIMPGLIRIESEDWRQKA